MPGLLAIGAIAAAILIMIAASLLRSSWMTPGLPMPASGPPWQLSARVPAEAVVAASWLAAALGGAGVMAGLVVVRRGGWLPVRALLAVAMTGIAALVVLPPVGTTDALDYAVYGHMAALGHSPYTTTLALFGTYHQLAGVPLNWAHRHSVYGPLATAEQLLAAKLGGRLLVADVFWLKLANALAFGAVAIGADRIFRADMRARLRAHLLWTANPLLLWTVVAGGHLDVLAAAAGIAGLLMLDRSAPETPPWRALAAGAWLGAAADVKASYALFGLAAAWTLHRQPGRLLAMAAGAAAILVPSFALAGSAAVRSALGAPGGRGIYLPLVSHLGAMSGHVLPLAGGLAIAVAVLALWRLPAGFRWAGSGRDAVLVRLALAISFGWLLVWPEQYPWYDVMVVCLLVFYPASRLDWLVLSWLTVATIADMPGLGLGGSPQSLGRVVPALHNISHAVILPLVIAAVVAALVAMSVTGRWKSGPPTVAAAPGRDTEPAARQPIG